MVITTSKSPKLDPMDAGFLAPLIAEFESSLDTLAHSSLTVRGYTDSARHFAAWFCDAGLQLGNIGKGTVDSFARHHCQCAGGRRWNGVSAKYARRAGRFGSDRLTNSWPCSAAGERQKLCGVPRRHTPVCGFRGDRARHSDLMPPTIPR
jgi:hypothetical protein